MAKPLMPILKSADNIKTTSNPLAGPDDKATKVVSFGNGWVIVQMTTGSHLKRSGGSLSWRNNNPGNIKWGDFAKGSGALGPGYEGHAVFPDAETGRTAQKKLLFTNIRSYNTKTIQEAMAVYAPSSDGNNSSKYAQYIASQLQVPVSQKLNQLNEAKKERMLDVMRVYEGYKVGTVKRVEG